MPNFSAPSNGGMTEQEAQDDRQLLAEEHRDRSATARGVHTMTTVEDAHSLVEAPPHVPKLLARPKETTGVWSWFTTVDHKKIGILYCGSRSCSSSSAASRRC